MAASSVERRRDCCGLVRFILARTTACGPVGSRSRCHQTIWSCAALKFCFDELRTLADASLERLYLYHRTARRRTGAAAPVLSQLPGIGVGGIRDTAFDQKAAGYFPAPQA